MCHLPPGHALIRYSNLGSALYAREKLNGFEYPPGNRLAVNFVDDGEDRGRYTHNAHITTQQYTFNFEPAEGSQITGASEKKNPLKLIYP